MRVLCEMPSSPPLLSEAAALVKGNAELGPADEAPLLVVEFEVGLPELLDTRLNVV